jgi:hypothetical protein
MTETQTEVQLPANFSVRIEPYWQSVAVYASTLILYVVIKSLWETTLQSGIVNIVLTDPIVVLLGAFVLISLLGLVITTITRRTLVVSENGITFSSRFHERVFTLEEIEKITRGRGRRIKLRGVTSHIKVSIRGRRRPLRIRPAVFTNEQQLVDALMLLKQRLEGRQA